MKKPSGVVSSGFFADRSSLAPPNQGAENSEGNANSATDPNNNKQDNKNETAELTDGMAEDGKA